MGYNVTDRPVISVDQTKPSHNGPTIEGEDGSTSLVTKLRNPGALKSQPRYVKDGLGSDPTCS